MKPTRVRCFLIPTILFSLAAATSAVGAPPTTWDKTTQAWIADRPGCVAVTWIDASGVSFTQAGQFTPEDARKPGPDTPFAIGSVTKVFTALLLAESERAGKVSRTDPVANLLLPAGDPARESLAGLTLLTLTTHTSGLPRLPSNLTTLKDPDPYAAYTRAMAVAALRTDGVGAKPGGSPAYSNFGVGLLGEALGAAWGVRYAEALQTHVLSPLGLTETRLALPSAAEAPDAAPGYDTDGPKPHWHFDGLAGAGALVSTSRDMGLFVQSALGLRETPLATAFAETMKPLRATDEYAGQIGMAWFITPEGVVWHNGATAAARSVVAFWPAKKIGAVVLTNAGGNPLPLAFSLLGAKPPAPAVVAVAEAAAFTGSYSLRPDISLLITERKGGLFVQLTAQPAIALKPAGTDRFATVGVAAELSFERDTTGRVVSVTLHQNGADQRAPRTPELTLTAEQAAAYAGSYPLTAAITNTVTSEGGQVFVQLTGQPRFPAFASGPDTFFLKVVNARLVFERDANGTVIAVTLHQNGRAQRMVKN